MRSPRLSLPVSKTLITRRTVSRKRLNSRLVGLLACTVISGPLLLLGQCSDSMVGGRAWVADGHSEKLLMIPDGALHIDRRFHPVVKRNYRGYIEYVVKVFKDKHLFNRNAVPLIIYFLHDAESFEKYCPKPAQGKSAFVANERSIYVHASGNPLVDGGVGQDLIRDIARAIMHDMYHGDYPAWLDVGVTRLFANGAFGPVTDAKGNTELVWFFGVPNPEQWKPLLSGGLPSFEEVRTASHEELAKMGAKGEAVATAAVYLLNQLEQLRNVIWRLRPEMAKDRDPATVVKAIKFFDPRYTAHFGDPVKAIFTLRPDYREYVELALAGQSADIERVRQNARDYSTTGGYWWQYASLQLKAGKQSEALEALESCCNCDPHRDQPTALVALARIYYEQKDWAKLKPIVLKQLRSSVLPTPTMHLMLAESVREASADDARDQVRIGLGLPGLGFESDVARLKALEVELEK